MYLHPTNEHKNDQTIPRSRTLAAEEHTDLPSRRQHLRLHADYTSSAPLPPHRIFSSRTLTVTLLSPLLSPSTPPYRRASGQRATHTASESGEHPSPRSRDPPNRPIPGLDCRRPAHGALSPGIHTGRRRRAQALSSPENTTERAACARYTTQLSLAVALDERGASRTTR